MQKKREVYYEKRNRGPGEHKESDLEINELGGVRRMEEWRLRSDKKKISIEAMKRGRMREGMDVRRL